MEDKTMSDDLLYFNGIDAVSGDYALMPMDPKLFSSIITGAPVDEAEMKALKNWHTYLTTAHWAIKEGHDPNKLEEAGWGIIYPHNVSPAIKDALAPLVAWRKAQAAASKEHYFREMDYRPNEHRNDWLVRHGYGPGPANPERIPYYILIVGDPDQIPYRFQTSLDVQYAVGRISFDTPEEYANYANSVVEAEKQQLRLARRMAFFGVSNADDPATRLSADQLIAPLLKGRKENPVTGQAVWDYQEVMKSEATKERLSELLGGPQTPAMLITASHGMGFPNGHNLQERHQGALLCQDWPGPRQWRGAIPDNFYFSGDDISENANLWGSIAFFFACYGAGTPKLDEFAQQAFKERGEIAKRSFIAKLPQRMLSHPKGGALAVIGHVERAWSYSFHWGKAGQTLEVFDSAFQRLMQGKPIGFAFEQFNERYAELSSVLTDALHEAKFIPPDPYDLAGMWTANNDAKNYVILGDPAVRMMVAEEEGAVVFERPTIQLTSTVIVKESSTEPDRIFAADAAGDSNLAALAEESSIVPVDFGAFDSVGSTLDGFVKKLGVFLGNAIDNAVTLKVRTYTSSNMDNVQMTKDGVIGANLRAATALYIDGDIDQVVPVEDGQVDMELLKIHLELVKQAEASRAELIKSAVGAAASLVNLRGLK
jgi:hypothetical protein